MFPSTHPTNKQIIEEMPVNLHKMDAIIVMAGF